MLTGLATGLRATARPPERERRRTAPIHHTAQVKWLADWSIAPFVMPYSGIAASKLGFVVRPLAGLAAVSSLAKSYREIMFR